MKVQQKGYSDRITIQYECDRFRCRLSKWDTLAVFTQKCDGFFFFWRMWAPRDGNPPVGAPRQNSPVASLLEKLTLLHRSAFKISARFRQTSSHFCNLNFWKIHWLFPKSCLTFTNFVENSPNFRQFFSENDFPTVRKKKKLEKVRTKSVLKRS